MTGRFYVLAVLAAAAIALVMPSPAHANGEPVHRRPPPPVVGFPGGPGADTTPVTPGLGAPVSPERTQPRIPGKANDASVLKGQEDTLFAPFSDVPRENAPANSLEELVPYVGPTAQGETQGLEGPHRSVNEVSDFLLHALTEILSIDYNTVLERRTGKTISYDEYQKKLASSADPNVEAAYRVWSYDDHLKKLAIGMDANALSDFQNFMTQSNILQTLQTNNLVMHCYVEEPPILLNKGAMDDNRYHWLFEMPVTLTFLPPGAKTYENQTSPLNKHVMIRMQVGRVPKKRDGHKEDPGIDEMMIESVKVTDNNDRRK